MPLGKNRHLCQMLIRLRSFICFFVCFCFYSHLFIYDRGGKLKIPTDYEAIENGGAWAK